MKCIGQPRWNSVIHWASSSIPRLNLTLASHFRVSPLSPILGSHLRFLGPEPLLRVLGPTFPVCPGLQVCNLIKKRLQHRCFPVNIAKILRKLFLQNISGGYFCLNNSRKWKIKLNNYSQTIIQRYGERKTFNGWSHESFQKNLKYLKSVLFNELWCEIYQGNTARFSQELSIE